MKVYEIELRDLIGLPDAPPAERIVFVERIIVNAVDGVVFVNGTHAFDLLDSIDLLARKG